MQELNQLIGSKMLTSGFIEIYILSPNFQGGQMPFCPLPSSCSTVGDFQFGHLYHLGKNIAAYNLSNCCQLSLIQTLISFNGFGNTENVRKWERRLHSCC